MPSVIFYVQAYNAEKTIGRTLDSLLHQTCGDWFCYCIDNGCTDKTGKIIEHYVQLDRRFKKYRVERNDPTCFFAFVPAISKNHSEEDFFTTLDADDEYTPGFVEEMLAFMLDNRLEIAACGNYFLNAKTDEIAGERVLQDNLILEASSQFSEYFPLYHQFTRTIWGKLYAISVLKKINWEKISISMYGADTLFCLENFSHASLIGILGKSLHKYYISPKSVSYQMDNIRIKSDVILHETACSFLTGKCGYISSRNMDFLLLVYMNALNDTLGILLNAQIPMQEKIAGIIQMFTHTYTGQLMARDHFCASFDCDAEMSARRRELFSTAATWLLSRDEVPDELVEGYCNAGERMSAAAENADGWLFFKKLRVRFFLSQNRKDEAKDSLSELAELIPNDPEVMDFQKSF